MEIIQQSLVLEEWPILDPRDLMEALINAGQLPLLTSTSSSRLEYWKHASVAFKRFTRDNLKLKKHEFPEMLAKGYDTYLVLRWLKEEFEGGIRGLEHEYALLWTSDAFLSVLSSGDAFLSAEEAEQVLTCGELFLKIWINRVHADPSTFRVRPKLHLLQHILLEATLRPSRKNCWQDATWMDEDFLKKVGRLVRRTHRRTAPKTGLQRYLVLLRHKLGIRVVE